MAWRGSRGAWLVVTLALGACQPLGELPLPPTALTGGGGGKALAERRELPAATPAAGQPTASPDGEDDADATDDD